MRNVALGGPAFHRVLAETLSQHRTHFMHLRRTKGDEGVIVCAIQNWPAKQDEEIGEQYWVRLLITRRPAKGEGETKVEMVRSEKMFGEWFLAYADGYLKGNRLILAGESSAGGNWVIPSVEIHDRVGTDWRRVALKRTEVESGMPGTQFARSGATVDPTRIEYTTRSYPELMRQPHVGPLIKSKGGWRIVGDQIKATPVVPIPSPLRELDRLAQLRKKGDRTTFDRSVPRNLQRRLWNLLPEVEWAASLSNLVEDETDRFQLLPTQNVVRFKRTKNGFAVTELTTMKRLGLKSDWH